MKKLFFFIAIATFSTIGLTSCSEDDPVVEIPTPNPNPNVEKQLVLSSNATYVKEKDVLFSELGKQVTFTTKSDSTAVTDVTYYVDGVAIVGNKYAHTTIAVVKVQAKRAGYLDSNILEIQFAQKPY
ncbi:hypothetical protein NU10_09630 [Flavobacterium dauae]|uniref:hypothetical protein n=1 Tax=Flavobacterium dauae TaxID=1563479 RepID=UPI00101B3C6E|nr:hypothetical protein [Flavobacterium dauae]WLD22978.1 hypothetical protein NU10_09630 [Flavobacterium dauae]